MLIFHTFKSVIVYSVMDGLSVLCIQKHCKEENYDLLSVDPWTWFGFILYNIQYTMYNIQYTIYNIQYTIYNIQYTIYNIQYTMHNIQYTIYNIQYTK